MNESVRWRYHAADASGTDVSGEIAAATERDAVDALRRRSLWVTTLEPVIAARRDVRSDVATGAPNAATCAATNTTARTSAANIVLPVPRAGLSLRTSLPWLYRGAIMSELAVLVRAMATLLSAGVPLDRVLAYASGPATGEELRRAFTTVRERVRAGDSLSAAVTRDPIFPGLFAPTVSAGESSGTLDASLAALADHLERSEAIRAKLRAALLYPALLGVASVLGLAIILLVVVPRFAALIADAGGTLPWSTRALIGVSGLLERGWWAVLVGAGVGAALLPRWLAEPRNRARWDAWRLAWPIVGRLERSRAAAVYTGVLALALKAGVPLLSTMRLARGVVPNRALAASLEAAEDRVRAGGGIASALDGVLPPLSVRLLDAGEASGDLAGMAARAADAADSETQRVVSGAVALVEPLLILFFGALVGFVALALLQAIYGLNARTL
ncbi:MAG: type II secretion system F family protein [Gemmatimonas sp.]